MKEIIENNKNLVIVISSLLILIAVFLFIKSIFFYSPPSSNKIAIQPAIVKQNGLMSETNLSSLTASTTTNTKMLIDEKGFIITMGLGGLFLIILFPLVFFKRR